MKINYIIVLIVVLFVGVLVYFKYAHTNNQNTQVEDPDAQVIKQLREQGDIHEKEHVVDFFLYFPDEDSANRASNDIHILGFEPIVEKRSDKEFVILIKNKMKISLKDMKDIRVKFDQISSKYQGDYDGWGTEIEK